MPSNATSPPVLIIGYGNVLRGDDGAGCAAARLLRDLLDSSADVREVHQLLPELAEVISRSDLVIFIDAARGNSPGRIVRKRIHPVRSTTTLAHHLVPQKLLAVAQDLYGRSPEAHLFSVVGESFDCSQVLSPRVRAALPLLARSAKRLIDHVIASKAADVLVTNSKLH